MIIENHEHYETPIQITEDKFKELGNRYIEELDAYKNSLNLYFVVFSKHEGKEWSGYAGYIFAKKKEDIESLLSVQCNADVTIRSIESVDVQEGTILYGERWKKV